METRINCFLDEQGVTATSAKELEENKIAANRSRIVNKAFPNRRGKFNLSESSLLKKRNLIERL